MSAIQLSMGSECFGDQGKDTPSRGLRAAGVRGRRASSTCRARSSSRGRSCALLAASPDPRYCWIHYMHRVVMSDVPPDIQMDLLAHLLPVEPLQEAIALSRVPHLEIGRRIAERTGQPARQVHRQVLRVVSGGTKRVQFYVADRIATAGLRRSAIDVYGTLWTGMVA
jgi:hypothetical protein